MYHSADSGASWQLIGSTGGNYIACSADGNLVVTESGPQVLVSTNAGTSWTALGPNAIPVGLRLGPISCSADGSTLAVVETDDSNGPSEIVTTPSSTWRAIGIPPAGPFFYPAIAMSANGTGIVAAIRNVALSPPTNCEGMLYATSSSGATYATDCTTVTNWTSVATSADGVRLVAVAGDGAIYTSTDAGTNWQQQARLTGVSCAGVASSADGAKLVMVASEGGIYTWQTTLAPVLSIVPTGNSLRLSWVLPSETFQLQEGSDLGTANWTTVATPPTLNLTNLQNQLSLPANAGPRFYRLQATGNGT